MGFVTGWPIMLTVLNFCSRVELLHREETLFVITE